MTKQDAYTLAQQQATQSGHPMELWEHVGGQSPARKIPAQGRWVVIDGLVVNGRRVEDEPRYVWVKRETIEPST